MKIWSACAIYMTWEIVVHTLLLKRAECSKPDIDTDTSSFEV